MAKTEGAQVAAEHEESLSSYWLLIPFKQYAYWWSFAFAYFSSKTPCYPPSLQRSPLPSVCPTCTCVVHIKQCPQDWVHHAWLARGQECNHVRAIPLR